MSEPLDPFSGAEEARIREIAREELSIAIRRALRSAAYDDLDTLFGVQPPEARRRSNNPGRSPAQIPPVFDEQAVPAALADDKPE